MSTVRGLVSLLLVLVAFGAVTAQPVDAAKIPTPATAVFYGDSLLYESAPQLTAVMAKRSGWTHVIRAFAGVAPCDWMSSLEGDLLTLAPKVVTLQTMGNTGSACMLKANGTPIPAGSSAYFEKYRADLRAFFGLATAAGVKVVFVVPLPTTDSIGNARLTQLSTIAKAEAAAFHGVSISVAPRNAVSQNGKYVATKRCLAGETAFQGCTAGQIIVRAPDGVHLCPVGYLNAQSYIAGCPVYSSGARRFATRLASVTTNPPPPVTP